MQDDGDEVVVDTDPEVEASGVDPESDEGAEEKAENKIAKMRKELEMTRKEKQENMDGWQRAKADYVNALRRFEEEKRGAKQAGVTEAVEALLPAFDAIERAKEHQPSLKLRPASGDPMGGFLAIIKQLEAAFASLGLTSVGQIGEPFDPTLHEAFGQDATDDKEKDDTVTAVIEKGWRRGEAIVRPAKVRVAHYTAEA